MQIDGHKRRLEIMDSNDIDGQTRGGISDAEKMSILKSEILSLKDKLSETSEIYRKVTDDIK